MLQFLTILSDNPGLRMAQIGLIVLAVIAVYLVCFTTRDILTRTDSFVYQLLCVLITALLPILGFLIYLLVRPTHTIYERETFEAVKKILAFTENAEVVHEDGDAEEAHTEAEHKAPPAPTVPEEKL